MKVKLPSYVVLSEKQLKMSKTRENIQLEQIDALIIFHPEVQPG